MSERPEHERKQTNRGWRWARIAAFSLVAWTLLAWFGAKALIVHSQLPRADALVLLAGSSTYIERSTRTTQLFWEGRAPKIVLTNDNLKGGWSHLEQRNLFFVERSVQELLKGGVPADRVEVIPQSVSNTYEEAVCLRKYAEAHDLRSILVVSSAYQSRRALWTLRRVFRGSDVVIGLDAPPPGEQTPKPLTWWCHKQGWKMVPGEYLKIIYYRLRY